MLEEGKSIIGVVGYIECSVECCSALDVVVYVPAEVTAIKISGCELKVLAKLASKDMFASCQEVKVRAEDFYLSNDAILHIKKQMALKAEFDALFDKVLPNRHSTTSNIKAKQIIENVLPHLTVKELEYFLESLGIATSEEVKVSSLKHLGTSELKQIAESYCLRVVYGDDSLPTEGSEDDEDWDD
jgi:hypothetical protein